jgi:hypothetical protein
MSRGYVLLANNTDSCDYIRMAYALALSIKKTQSAVNAVSLITNTSVDDKYRSVFDKIIPVPWSQDDTTRFKVNDRWKIYHATPYEETVVLDCDMLVFDDLSRYWEVFSKYDIYYTNKVKDYRGNYVTSDFYRKAFTANNLPNLYSALHYFKKRDTAKEFYNWVELITNNWELFYGKFVSEHYPGEPSMDVTAALAAKILGIENMVTGSANDSVTFTHMKPMIQDWRNPTENWLDGVGVYFNKTCQMKIGNFQQQGIFHYVEKDFLTDRIIQKLEDL